MKIINGQALAKTIKDKITKEINNLHGSRPNLAIILIGCREDSQLYVSLKEKQAKTVGIDTHLYKCEADISETRLLETVKYLNNDPEIDAILVQLPLPTHIDTSKIINAIDPQKDIDGFHQKNLDCLTKKTEEFKIMPPVYGVILEILKSINYNLQDKNVCLIAKADIFKNDLAKLLTSMGGQVVLAKVDEDNLSDKTKSADVLITAIGQPSYIKARMIKPGAVIIDIGIAKVNGHVKGDVDRESVKDKAGYLTPVPGGVGPLTIAMAFKNTLEVYKQKYL